MNNNGKINIGTVEPPTKAKRNVNGVLATAAAGSATEKPKSDFPVPCVLADESELVWDDDDLQVNNFLRLGERLAGVGDLYRRPDYADGLLMAASEPNIEPKVIQTGSHLAAIIADRVRVRRMKGGNSKDSQIPAAHLTTMLHSEVFLQYFRSVDAVVRQARYLPNFELIRPGYNDGGPGKRFLYTGGSPRVENSLEAINKFLEVMAFTSKADRTNAVGLALTVMLRNLWPGTKPIAIVTSSKSHGGKDTIVAFAAGSTPKVSVDYQSTDWAFRQALVAALQACPDAGVVNVENARIEKGGTSIASATLERLLTDPNPVLHSTQCRDSLKVRNDIVTAITTNFGTVSEDLMNRGLPIRLSPVGDVADRISSIGDPKLEYLPANRELIEAELRGMIERWKSEGRKPDKDVRHPFTDWVGTVGGILKANGFGDFLANYSLRRTADNPLRQALGLLGNKSPGEWKPADAWAKQAVRQGLMRRIVPKDERDTDESRARGMGIALSAHRDETFVVEDDDVKVTLRLRKVRRRFDESKPSTRYCFEAV